MSAAALAAILAWSARAAGLLLVLISAASIIRTGLWIVRLCDFPRLQITALAVVVTAMALGAIGLRGWTAGDATVLAAMGLVLVWQLAHVVRYTGVWPREAPEGQEYDAQTSLLVINVDVRNEEHDAMRDLIVRTRPDLLLLIEVDERWNRALEPLALMYRYRVGVTRSAGLGLWLWSRSRLSSTDIRCVIDDDRPSLWATVHPQHAREFRFVGVHPTPPALPKRSGGNDRHDSRIRDAELVHIAREIADDQDQDWIVAGDFNDVAWSHTTRLFKRLSGLRDPRIGRGLFNTYHARYPLLRYPLDHVFLSDGFGMHSLQRIRATGSDHFAMAAHLTTRREQGLNPESSAEDRQEASTMVTEGAQQAREGGRKSAARR